VARMRTGTAYKQAGQYGRAVQISVEFFSTLSTKNERLVR
jgi:hypothetical protein